MAGACGGVNEPSGAINCGGISQLAIHLLPSQERLCSMELYVVSFTFLLLTILH